MTETYDDVVKFRKVAEAIIEKNM